MWAAELYFEDFLQNEPVVHARLHANEAVANEPNSWNDNFAIFNRVWRTQNGAQRRDHLSTQDSFLSFPSSVIGPVGQAQTHWIPLLKHTKWNEHVQQLISHPWGRRNLIIANIERAIHSHHPRVSLSMPVIFQD